MKKTKFGDYEQKVLFEVWSNYAVHIVFTDDLAKSRIARYGSAGAAGDIGTGALFTRGNGGYGHLFFQIDACARVLTHEAWHAVWAMFEWAGVKDWDNETVAYHLGYLVGKISDFQAKVLGVKSSSRKQDEHGNKDTQGSLANVQGVPAHTGGVGTEEARKAGAQLPSPQADGCGDTGCRG
jgi:hypothetical protein